MKMSAIPRIVILGSSQSGKKTLFQGISRFLEFDHKKNPERVIDTGKHIFNCYDANVWTKYYKAPIELCICNGDNSVLTSEEIKQAINENCQGIIFVCKSTDLSALQCVTVWNNITKEIGVDIELRLVIHSHSDINSSLTSKNVTDLKNWCIDNLFEFIPCNLRVPFLTWRDQEKEGVSRVIENIECVMWSSMDTSNHRTTERVIEESIIMSSSELEQCAYCHKSKNVDRIPMYICSRCKMVSYCSRDCQIKDWKNHKTFCNQVSGYDAAVKQKHEEEQRLKQAEQNIMSYPTPPKEKEEAEMESFASLMQEVRNVKAQAKDLPDDERKKRAAQMAVKIMKEFQLGDDDEMNGILDDLQQ